jgi:hypothetical protein
LYEIPIDGPCSHGLRGIGDRDLAFSEQLLRWRRVLHGHELLREVIAPSE